MEPLFGRSLADAIAEESSLSVAGVTALGLRLLDVLQAAHEAGVVHCDVKPANVHLGNDGRVVLTDWGIAHRIHKHAAETTQMMAASPAYAAPERLRGDRPEPASDLSPSARPCSPQWRAERRLAAPRCSTPSWPSSKVSQLRSATLVLCGPS